MPLSNYLSSNYKDTNPTRLRTQVFHGINQAPDEGDLSVGSSTSAQGNCYTHKGVNFWIDSGNLMVRNNYEAILPVTISAGFGDYTYKIKSMHVCSVYGGTVGASAPIIYLGVDSYSGTTKIGSHIIYKGLNDILNVAVPWEFVTFGSNTYFSAAIIFGNSNFSFVNYQALDYSNGINSGVIATNGADPPYFIVANYASLLNYGGWQPVTDVWTSTEKFGCSALATDALAIEFFSPSRQYPSPVVEGTTYYTVGCETTHFQISTDGTTPLNITTTGANLYARLITYRSTDAPKGSHVMLHDERLWMNRYNTLYYSKAYDATAHTPGSNDWSTALVTGDIQALTWDGDTVNSMRNYNGHPLITKENSVFEISGSSPPYTVTQLYTSKGTIAPKSIVWYNGDLFFAAAEGIMAFNSASTYAYLTAEIKNIWYSLNTNCICEIVKDVLYIYANLYHPVTGTLGYGLLAVDLLTKNVCYWDMSLAASTLTVDAVLEPWFTTLRTNTVSPEFWFASGDQIYRISATAPAAGAAPAMSYYMPSTDYGIASKRKRISRVIVTGSGGTMTITPIKDGTAQTSKTLELPTRPIGISVNGYRLGLKIENTADPIVINNIEQEYSVQG